METKTCDLVVVGGGPAGLSASINGASEGLKVILFDTGPELGGQARKSSMIENYPGFANGVSGEDLIRNCIDQAAKFKTQIICPRGIQALRYDDTAKRILLTDEFGGQVVTKTIILANGLSYRTLDSVNLAKFLGRGAYYGVPSAPLEMYTDRVVAVVGGANSAGQAAMQIASNPRAKVKILVRKKLDIQMSMYLVERIKAAPNIEVIEGVEVTAVTGNEHLREVEISSRNGKSSMLLDAMFIFIGADPKTAWLQGRLTLDSKNFILTGPRVTTEAWRGGQERTPGELETCIPGVYAAGDVRFGSTKRITAAVGEGTVALGLVHTHLRLLNGS